MNFPNESGKYRSARDELLQAEISLRRKLPAGGEAQDYVFDSEEGAVRLSELFKNGHTLVAYSFMRSRARARLALPQAAFVREEHL